MLAVCAGLTLGILLLAFVVITLQHGAHPVQNAPAGGLKGFADSLQIVLADGVPWSARSSAPPPAAQDLETGVFRDLVATGRSRTALFLSRVGRRVGRRRRARRDHAGGRRRGRVRARRRHRHAARWATSARASRWCSPPALLGAALARRARRAGRLARPGDRASCSPSSSIFAPLLARARASSATPARRCRSRDQPHRRPGRGPRLHARARHLGRGRRSPGPRPRWPPAPGARGPGRSRLRACPFRRGCASRRPRAGHRLTLLVIVLVLPGRSRRRPGRQWLVAALTSSPRCRCWSGGAGRTSRSA